jgi:hypothetical protein
MTIWCGSCLRSPVAVNITTLGGIDGMSKVYGKDDVGAVLRFLSRVLCMEMH